MPVMTSIPSIDRERAPRAVNMVNDNVNKPEEQSLQPWQMWPAPVAAVEAFSKQPKPTHEQVLAQFKRNREQLAEMQKGSPSSNGQPETSGYSAVTICR
jgi:hypothetical protein